MSLFRTSNLGLLSYYLGIEVAQRLGQAAYTGKLLD
jgi:hypothetical protein